MDGLFRRLDRWQKLVILFVLAGVITLFHYRTPVHWPFSHELFARFYYLPILLGGLWFGVFGGLGVSLLVTAVYLPHVWMGWGPSGPLFWDKILEIVLFNLIGAIVGILTDMEHREREKTRELEALAALGEATASVTHEIKNLTIPIRGFLDRIKRTCPASGQCALYQELVDRESARLENVTRDIGAFARQQPLQTEAVEIGPFFEDLCASLEGLFQRDGIRLVCQGPDQTAWVTMDPEKMRQVLVNLLQNAFEASSRGMEVRLVAQLERKNLSIRIEDQGEGISRENLDRIYDPFFTTKHHGTGLGLSISRKIVKQHGGEVEIESAVGKGTRVDLRIPTELQRRAKASARVPRSARNGPS